MKKIKKSKNQKKQANNQANNVKPANTAAPAAAPASAPAPAQAPAAKAAPVQQPVVKTVKVGSVVLFHYRKKLAYNNVVIEDSRLKVPCKIIEGQHRVMIGLEKGILGMTVGQTKEFFVPAAEAHGELTTDEIVVLKKAQISKNFNYKVGQVLMFKGANGVNIAAEILKITHSSVILNTNHPLAGEDLIFEVQILDIA